MQRRPQTQFTLAQYLAMEALQEFRSEFFWGEIYAMAGGTLNHNTLIGNLSEGIRSAVRDRGCRLFTENVKVVSWRDEFSAYPDVLIVCGPIVPARPNDRTTVTNPSVIVEVLSEATAEFDRGGKFTAYRQFESLQEYVLLHQDRMVVEQYWRQADGWSFPQFTTEGEVTICGGTVPVADLYRDVDFSA